MTIKHRQAFGNVALYCSNWWLVALFALFLPSLSTAAETICARVKIEIKQELTLERQAFDAQMNINNTTPDGVIEKVSVEVKVTDENGTPVAVSDNPNDQNAKFFIRVSNKENITDINGGGMVNPQTSGIINWLLIPAPGSAGDTPFGKKYLVGATLKYTFAGTDTSLDVSPDVITVKPLPLLTLDYFLTQNVLADDALTPEIEPVEPFTLGVRVKNEGQANAQNLKIDSAQPKIIENKQGLLINFLLAGSYVDDQPVQNSLLIDFGDIAVGTSKMGRWVMETSLAGKFTEFSAKFSHADELGGTLTSIIKATNSHFLIHDVQVDLLGRDSVRDFLALDGSVIRIYESDGTDTLVTDRSAATTLTPVSTLSGKASYKFTMPATQGFVYVKLPDPFNGEKVIGNIVRSDGKLVSSSNAWLSKTRNETTKQWQYWVNLFDANTTGVYGADFQTSSESNLAPVLQFIPDRQVQETSQVSFLVEASSPQGKPVTITAQPLPQGATFDMQPKDNAVPNLARAVIDWTPTKGQAGDYRIVYTATDGTLSSKAVATITVTVFSPASGPETPTISAPISGAHITKLKPNLSVQTSINPADLTKQVQFEVYSDEAMTQLVASSQVDEALPAAGNGAGSVPQPTSWLLPIDLQDNTYYWWRARAFDGTVYSPWVNAKFFVNLFNDPPNNFSLTFPDPDAEVGSLTPTLTWNNSKDQDGDAVTYDVLVYSDPALANLVVQDTALPEDASGSTSWLVTTPLSNRSKYYWKVLAKDSLKAQTPALARPFIVNTGNVAPTAPEIISPEKDGQSDKLITELKVKNSLDADHDPISYVFEVDKVSTFDSPAKTSSGAITEGLSGTTSWTTSSFAENQRYWWRVKAQDGLADSAWVVGNFLVNVENDPPEIPIIKNPGNGAWSTLLQPTLEVNPVLDPEGKAVRYQFEVYKDANLTVKVAGSISTATAVTMPVAFMDKSTYWWRVRALDQLDLPSDWSAAAVLYVSTGTNQEPSIAVTEPATPILAKTVRTPSGVRKQVTINWEGITPNNDSTVALYYSSKQNGFTGTLIVGGLKQVLGIQSGNYVWDVTNRPAGTYYIYATISDSRGVGSAYAPGALVIPNQPQTGKILVTAASGLYTSENGTATKFSFRLGSAPSSDVVVPVSANNPREGAITPASVTFTNKNWSTNQEVTITGKDDCETDGIKNYKVQLGSTVSFDPNYIGLSGIYVNLSNIDNWDMAGTTNDPTLHICGMKVVTETLGDDNVWEYTLSARMTKTGTVLSGINAKLVEMPANLQIVKGILSFGVSNQGDTIVSDDTIVVRTPTKVSPAKFYQGSGFKWEVTPLP